MKPASNSLGILAQAAQRRKSYDTYLGELSDLVAQRLLAHAVFTDNYDGGIRVIVRGTPTLSTNPNEEFVHFIIYAREKKNGGDPAPLGDAEQFAIDLVKTLRDSKHNVAFFVHSNLESVNEPEIKYLYQIGFIASSRDFIATINKFLAIGPIPEIAESEIPVNHGRAPIGASLVSKLAIDRREAMKQVAAIFGEKIVGTLIDQGLIPETDIGLYKNCINLTGGRAAGTFALSINVTDHMPQKGRKLLEDAIKVDGNQQRTIKSWAKTLNQILNSDFQINADELPEIPTRAARTH